MVPGGHYVVLHDGQLTAGLHRAPGIPDLRRVMQHHHERTVSRLSDVRPDAIGVDLSVGGVHHGFGAPGIQALSSLQSAIGTAR
jgi:hypothetical protein